MILEGLVTTLDRCDNLHVAAMGPQVDGPEVLQFELRPFSTSQTFRNLKRRGEGVLHVIDDALLLARAAIGQAGHVKCRTATKVQGFILEDCCRYFEFLVASMDESQERVRIQAEVVSAGRLRDFFGWNRAKHAVVEAAILATRTSFLQAEHIASEMARLQVLVEKTGGPAELEAMMLLMEYTSAACSGHNR